MPDDREWEKVGEPPGIYPAELWDWYKCYYPNPPGKLAHDAMLYLAEAGIRHLATVAYSIARQDRSLTDEPGLFPLGRHLSFGDWVKVLRACESAVPGWDFSQIPRGALTACGRLTTVSNMLDELRDVDTMTPVEKALASSPKKLQWWSAWNVLVEYRNKTLGHPNASVLKTRGFHELLTEVVAAAVAELLWNQLVAEAFSQHREAWFSSRTTGRSYKVLVRASNRMRQPLTLVGDEGGGFDPDDQLILSSQGGRLVFRCRKQDPQGVPPGSAPGQSDAILDAPGVQGRDGLAENDARSQSTVQVEVIDEPMSRLDLVPTNSPSAEAHGVLGSWDLPFLGMTEVVPTTFTATGEHGESYKIEISERFFVAQFPVTQLLYARVMQENPSRFQADSHPVEFVSWIAAVEFCNKLSTMSDLEPVYENVLDRGWRVDASKPGFRLLMEDEWAYCCSTGHIDDSDTTPLCGSATTSPVDADAANRLGLHSMLGNVWEWCNDIYQTGYSAATVSRLIEPDSRSPRVIRGGSFVERPGIISPGSRSKHLARAARKNIGFRIGRSVPNRSNYSSSESS
jgi:hypothetical protein